MNNSNTFYSGKVTSSDMNKLYTVKLQTPEYIRLRMISDVIGVPFDEVITVILSFGFERFEQEFNCSFGIQEI
ncbi:hypothetical protein ATT74_26115 [Salmonella enterica subsp. enterica serovar Panama]|uniref:Uncharacterized protein n=1 Tax=Salmonella enterica subsp. enterica serovar Panama TaxID=29472 RepID=A0A619AEB1_SALET|nr:hypothetical protein [Salmonella enterica subsp. enterica serovar Panama]ECX3494249.1 hypothetical protein [Salmonella enterica subsp. enterica serovar Panama]ECX6033862.1 hypothetical protein [Salmonella enterica subsp. enterica serovar Panama]EGU5379580.1 hypothetical protein [Salmonella enterica]EGX1719565.1 hypothetical protein [Salmonella enterica subsp. enterica serovar Panama]